MKFGTEEFYPIFHVPHPPDSPILFHNINIPVQVRAGIFNLLTHNNFMCIQLCFESEFLSFKLGSKEPPVETGWKISTW